MEHAIANATMKRLGLSVFALLIATQFTASCGAAGKDRAVTVIALQTEFDQSLPKGTPLATVESYLKKKGFGSSGEIDNAKLAHMGGDPSTYSLETIVRNVRKSVFVTTDISVTFTFGRDRLLRSTTVKEVHTGL